MKRCPVCEREYAPRQRSQRTCGTDRCRKTLWRREQGVAGEREQERLRRPFELVPYYPLTRTCQCNGHAAPFFNGERVVCLSCSKYADGDEPARRHAEAVGAL